MKILVLTPAVILAITPTWTAGTGTWKECYRTTDVFGGTVCVLENAFKNKGNFFHLNAFKA